MLAIPAFAGLATSIPWNRWSDLRRRIAGFALVAALIANVVILIGICPRGLVGYDEIGRFLAESEEPGNVLLASMHDQDAIYHERANGPKCVRYFIRSDRTLAIRVSEYAKQKAIVRAHSAEDVFSLIELGKVGFVVACEADDPARDRRPIEMELVLQTVRNNPDRFERVHESPLTVQFTEWPTEVYRLTIWKVKGPIREGKPDISVEIPTAHLILKP